MPTLRITTSIVSLLDAIIVLWFPRICWMGCSCSIFQILVSCSALTEESRGTVNTVSCSYSPSFRRSPPPSFFPPPSLAAPRLLRSTHSKIVPCDVQKSSFSILHQLVRFLYSELCTCFVRLFSYSMCKAYFCLHNCKMRKMIFRPLAPKPKWFQRQSRNFIQKPDFQLDGNWRQLLWLSFVLLIDKWVFLWKWFKDTIKRVTLYPRCTRSETHIKTLKHIETEKEDWDLRL